MSGYVLHGLCLRCRRWTNVRVVRWWNNECQGICGDCEDDQ